MGLLSRRLYLCTLASLFSPALHAARGPLDGAPDDDFMIRHLKQNMAKFEAIVAMAREDRGLIRIDEDWTEPADLAAIGIGPDRLADYRRRFSDLGVPRGISVHATGSQVDFLAFARGWGPRGFSRSYVWSASGEFEDAEIATNLDALQASGRRRVWAFRHVNGPWWLHLRND